MDRHVLAAISIAGTSLDLLGGMYLAYDLLGGKHGPLRALTRGVTYTAIFAILYGLPLGWRFGLASGLAHGITLALELSRAASEKPDFGLGLGALFSFIRGLGFGIGLYYDFGWKFAVIFCVFSTVGQTIAYRIGLRPSMEYAPAARPSMSRRKWFGVLNRTAGYVITGLICGAVAQGAHSFAFALKVGLSIGVATAVGSFIMPYVEWISENLPARRLGIFGIGLILCGFSLQSIQYWTTLLDIPIK